MNLKIRHLLAFWLDQAIAIAATVGAIRAIVYFFGPPGAIFSGIVVAFLVLFDYLGIGRRLLGARLHFRYKGYGPALLGFAARQISFFVPLLLLNFFYIQAGEAVRSNPPPYLPYSETNEKVLNYLIAEQDRLRTLTRSFQEDIGFTFLSLFFALETLSILQTGRRFFDPWAGITPLLRTKTPAPEHEAHPAA